ncbi:MAG TPA: chemotaxis protein CheB, partial [Rubrivivax sp.]|nr:chemotaxis protein CheB [Rubrivivax sp.]
MNQLQPTPTTSAQTPDLPGDTDAPVHVERSHLRFPVVGIGASAGGLAALTRFFEASPPTGGMAYVVILHLSPKH